MVETGNESIVRVPKTLDNQLLLIFLDQLFSEWKVYLMNSQSYLRNIDESKLNSCERDNLSGTKIELENLIDSLNEIKERLKLL